MSRLRKIADLHHELIEPVEWKAPEVGRREYPVPEEFQHSLEFDPPSTGVVTVDPAWLKNPRWMQKHQSKVAKLFAEHRVRLEGTG